MANRDSFLMSAFFLMLPFIYAGQVLCGRPEAGLIGYVPLFMLVVSLVIHKEEYLSLELMRPQLLTLSLFALTLHNAASGLGALLEGDVGLGGRVLCLFVLPFVIFVVGRRLTVEQHWRVMKLVALTALIIAGELLWENICNSLMAESSWFQLLNHDYVLGQTGKNLTQLYLPEYRGTGLLEHVHVSVFYVVAGIAASVTVYVGSGASRYLVTAVFCTAILVAHGVRFALVAGVAAIVFNLIFILYNRSPHVRERVRNIALSLSLTFVFVLITDPFGTVRLFYIPVLTQWVWNLDRPTDFTPEIVISNGMKGLGDVMSSRFGMSAGSEEFRQGLVGHGIARSLGGNVVGLDDDFFVAQIFAQLGLLGGVGFYVIFFAAFREIRTIGQLNGDRGLLVAFALALVFLLGISTLHSGVIQRKVMFALYFWVLAIIHYSSNCCPLKAEARAPAAG